MSKRKKWFYKLVGLAFLALLINVLIHTPISREDVSSYPQMTRDEISAKYEELEREVAMPLKVGHGADQYRAVNHQIKNLEKACKRYTRQYPNTDPRFHGAQVHGAPLSQISEKNIKRGLKYFSDFPKEHEELMEKNRGSEADYFNIPYEDNSQRWKEFWVTVFWAQVIFMPFAFLIFAIRIREEGGVILFEIMSNYRLPMYLLLWEVGLFMYKGTSARRQVRRMVRYASLAMSAVLSFGTATLKAQTKKEKDDGGSGQGHTLVLSGSSHYLSKYLGLDGGIFHPDPVIQSSLTIGHRSGLYVGFWNSVAVGSSSSVPNFGRERDYTIGYSRKIGKRSIDVLGTYLNVTPLGRRPKGDVLQEKITISNVIPGLPFSNYLVFWNAHSFRDGPKGGQFVHFGVTRSVKIWGKTHLDLGGEAVFDSGAFGFDRAGLVRGNAVFKVPWKGLTFDLPVFRMSSPFTRPHDGRKFEKVLGFGLSFSFAH